MIVPVLIKAGDERVLLGPRKQAPKVDCRVIAEETYQMFIDILDDVRSQDIESFIEGKANLLPRELRRRIQDVLKSNDR